MFLVRVPGSVAKSFINVAETSSEINGEPCNIGSLPRALQ